MSILTRLEDVRLMILNNRYEGALLNVLVATSATARKRFPKGTKGDRDAFEIFVAQETPNVMTTDGLSLFFQGQMRPLGEVLYKWLRCNLAHEAELPPEIEFVPDPAPGLLHIGNAAGPPQKIILSHTLVFLLADMVIRAKENSDLPRDLKETIFALKGNWRPWSTVDVAGQPLSKTRSTTHQPRT